MKNCITIYKIRDIVPATKAVLDAGADPQEILDNGMITAMTEVRDGFKNNTIYMPQMLITTETMQAGLEITNPMPKGNEGEPIRGRTIIGSVMGDVHDIGKDLVVIIFEGSGLEVTDLGADVLPEKFIEAVKENKGVNFVACSYPITPNREAFKDTVKLLNDLPNHDDMTIMVGDTTINQIFSDEIGVDIYTAEVAPAS